MAKRTKTTKAAPRSFEAAAHAELQLAARAEFMAAIGVERNRQIAKWGTGNPGFPTMVAVLTEEVGEVARAVLDGDRANLRTELEQVAAVACRMAEQVQRGDRLTSKSKAAAALSRRRELQLELQKLTAALDSAARFFLGTGKKPNPEDFAAATLAARRLREAL